VQIGLISDIHGNLHALMTVLQTLDAADVDLILCAGDLVCYGAHPNEVLGILRKRELPSVVGNYDDAVAWNRSTASRKPSSPTTEPLKRAALTWTQAQTTPQHVSYLRALPWSLIYRYDGLTIQLLHAGPDALDEWISPDEPARLELLAAQLRADVIVLGHTHQPFTRVCGSTLLINPGAVGRSLDGDTRAAYAIFDTETRQVNLQRINYDVDAAVRAITASGMPAGIDLLLRHGARRLEEVLR